eukprot:CAMPEP_0170109740 /NCGR_PEP_ID=MMETSP0020_2-20130122/7422_1 /TAXON_ID=98059 /ORGANISM="Dinobryon sp., Strain UTEXLB2267" /LENGTH=33 /DNA_ID= /DNA_START= /DNA_END= /DNA_ORIENTATION=
MTVQIAIAAGQAASQQAGLVVVREHANAISELT